MSYFLHLSHLFFTIEHDLLRSDHLLTVQHVIPNMSKSLEHELWRGPTRHQSHQEPPLIAYLCFKVGHLEV